MTRMKRNPFETSRWEDEDEHLVCVPHTLLEIGDKQNCYLPGIRGSGKTTILNTLDYRCRLSDAASFYNSENIPRLCLGVYINLLHQFTASFEFLEEHGEVIHWNCFQLYFHMLSFAEAFETIHIARLEGELAYDAAQEMCFVEDIYETFPFIRNFRRETSSNTFINIASSFRKACMKIRVECIRANENTILDIVGKIDPSFLLSKLCKGLEESKILHKEYEKYFVSICVDNSHFLSEKHQIYLNTIVQERLSPVAYKVAYVRGLFNSSSTRNERQMLARHDRQIIPLDFEGNNSNFRAICKQIFTARLRHYTVGNPALKRKESIPRTDLFEFIFGRSDYNQLFELMLKSSKSTKLKKKLTSGLRDFENWYDQKLKRSERKGQRLYYQWYICQELFDGDLQKLDQFFTGKSGDIIDNYFRQKNAAALIRFCSETGREVPYGGANVIEAMADGVIRDFIRILSRIYIDTDGSSRTHYFNAYYPRRIKLSKQVTPIRKASQEYWDAAKDRKDKWVFQLLKIIDCFCRLSFVIQTEGERSLHSPERGLFVLDFSERSLFEDEESLKDHLKSMILKGQDLGLLRVANIEAKEGDNVLPSDRLVFRIHKILAPKYRLSTRAPMREFKVPLQSVLEIITEYEHVNADEWTNRTWNMIKPSISRTSEAASLSFEEFERF